MSSKLITNGQFSSQRSLKPLVNDNLIFRKNRYNALKKIMDDKKVEQEKAMELPHPAVECGEETRAGHINGGYSRRGSRGRDKYDSSKYEPRFHREVSHAVMQSCSHAVMQSYHALVIHTAVAVAFLVPS